MRVFTVLQTWTYFYSYKNITLPKVDEKKMSNTELQCPTLRGEATFSQYELAWEK